MSNKIPILGKIWIIAMIVIQSLGAAAGLLAGTVSSLFFLLAVVEIVVVVCAIMLLLGKGLLPYIGYCISYSVAKIASPIIAGKETPAAFIVGTIIGLALNLAVTYLAAKNTFSK